MAGPVIYVGNLFKNMIDAIASLVTKMDTQISKMDSQIAALTAINTAVGQNITTGKVVPGTEKSILLNTADVIGPSDSLEYARAKCFADGKIFVTGTIKSSSSQAVMVQYSVDGGVTKTTAFSTTSTSYINLSGTINVLNNQEIIFYLNRAGTNIQYLQGGTSCIQYSLLHIETDGFIKKL